MSYTADNPTLEDLQESAVAAAFNALVALDYAPVVTVEMMVNDTSVPVRVTRINPHLSTPAPTDYHYEFHAAEARDGLSEGSLVAYCDGLSDAVDYLAEALPLYQMAIRLLSSPE